MSLSIDQITPLEQRIIDAYQHDLPVCSRPFQRIAEQLNCDESSVIAALQRLQQGKVLSRVGPVFNHAKAGASVLAAMAVPLDKLEEVAAQVNAFDGVNHNYAREHEFNLWFVVTACDDDQLQQTIADIENTCGYAVMALPMLKKFFIDLGFKVDWRSADAALQAEINGQETVQ